MSVGHRAMKRYSVVYQGRPISDLGNLAIGDEDCRPKEFVTFPRRSVLSSITDTSSTSDIIPIADPAGRCVGRRIRSVPTAGQYKCAIGR